MRTFLPEVSSSVQQSISDFVAREMPPFLEWLKDLRDSRRLCRLILNPSPEGMRIPDGTYSLTFVDPLLPALEYPSTRDVNGSSVDTVFMGIFPELLNYLHARRTTCRHEIVIAFFDAFRGASLGNCPAFRGLRQRAQLDVNNIDEPLRDAVAQRILSVMISEGLVR